jgi:hypothetical protein
VDKVQELFYVGALLYVLFSHWLSQHGIAVFDDVSLVFGQKLLVFTDDQEVVVAHLSVVFLADDSFLQNHVVLVEDPLQKCGDVRPVLEHAFVVLDGGFDLIELPHDDSMLKDWTDITTFLERVFNKYYMVLKKTIIRQKDNTEVCYNNFLIIGEDQKFLTED